MVAIIIPHQLSLAPPTCPPSRFQRTASQSTAVRFFVSSNPLFCFQQSSHPFPSVCYPVSFVPLSCFLWSAFLFPSFRLLVPFGPFPCSLCSVSSFLSVRFPVPFVPLLRFFWSATPFLSYPALVLFGPLPRFLCSALSFSSFRLLVSFWLLLRFLRSVSCFLWSGSTRHYLVVSSFLSLSSLPFCQLFSLLSNPTHAFQRSRPCPSTFKNTPFLLQEHALQRSRTRPSSPVSVCAWFRVSCKFRFASFPPPSVGTFVCVLVKFFHTPKRLVGSFLSHVV